MGVIFRMTKIRVHELAKEFGMTSKEMADRIKDLGYPIKNYMSTLEDYEAQEIRKKLRLQVEEDKKEKTQEERPQKVIRRRHRVLHIKRIIKKSEVKPKEEKPTPKVEEPVKQKEEKEARPEEKKVHKSLVKKLGTLPEIAKKKEGKEKIQKETEEVSIKVSKDEVTKEGKKEEEIVKEKVIETKKTEKAESIILPQKEEKSPLTEKAIPKETKKEEKIKKEKEKHEAKPLVKILQRPPVEPKKEKAIEEKPSKPEEKKDKKKSEEVTLKFPKEITLQPEAEEKKTKPSKAKGKKKGKRVVKATDLGASGKKRKPFKKKDKKEAIRQILKEEEGISKVGKKAAKVQKTQAQKEEKPVGTAPIKAEKRKITMVETIQVSELAKKMGVKEAEVIMKLMSLGVMATANQTIDYDTAALIASEFGYEVEKKSVAEDIIEQIQKEVKGGEPVPRPPVVTIMGHVDHGKTTLLDTIRKSDVAAKEAGGITQHIGAYEVTLPSGDQVVFLDTPGHEAFTSMRARGASVTDVVILVVAADDGVMAQTREAIDHARAANVPIIVAVNKIDKPGANPDRVKTELSELGLVPEDWGGDTIFVNVSAKMGTGIDELLELLVLQAEVLELKADPKRPAIGTVIESKLDRGRGPVATLLVKEGTLHIGDAIVCGLHYGKVRAMLNDRGEKIEEAGPSKPVEVQGLSGVPEAGTQFIVVPNEKKAREVAEYRQRKAREAELAKSKKISLETVFEKMKEKDLKVLNLVIKADVQGSLEAISEALKKLSTDKIKIEIVRGGIGAITESDVLLASASDAIIIGFNVKPSPQAKQLAAKEHVDIRFYDVIYHAIEQVKDAMAGLLEPIYKEEILGTAEVRQTFRISKVGTVAGCYVLDGVIKRNALARLLRDNVVVYTGKIDSLRRFKDDVKEVQAGYECGIGLEKFNDIKVGDVIEAYEMKEIKPDIGSSVEEASENKQDN